MTAAEEGVLLLCSRLGDPDSRPLTLAQFRDLGVRVRQSAPPADALRQLRSQDLTALGYSREQAEHILALLDRDEQLNRYLSWGQRHGMEPLTRLSAAYPSRFRRHRGLSGPPVLFCRGDLSLLERPSVAVIGSRKLCPDNEAFAIRAGRQAALENLVLVSGGAAGADLTAQTACLEAGGSCIIFPAGSMTQCPAHDRVLYLAADGYDLPFSAPRALYRNSLIHMQGDKVLAAQCSFGTGGTWQGCLENLKHGWSPLFVFDDGSQGAQALIEHGATAVHKLSQIGDLRPSQISFL